MAQLIAVTGMPGSGKGEVVSHLTSKFNFQKVYFGGTILDIVKERGLEVNENNERTVREEIRKQHGPAAMAIVNEGAIIQALQYGDVVIDGLYSWEEYKFLKDGFLGMIDAAVWAPPALRYARLAERPERPLTLSEAIARDYSQLENLHTGGPIAMADVTFDNSGELHDLHISIDRYVAKLTNSHL